MKYNLLKRGTFAVCSLILCTFSSVAGGSPLFIDIDTPEESEQEEESIIGILIRNGKKYFINK